MFFAIKVYIDKIARIKILLLKINSFIDGYLLKKNFSSSVIQAFDHELELNFENVTQCLFFSQDSGTN